MILFFVHALMKCKYSSDVVIEGLFPLSSEQPLMFYGDTATHVIVCLSMN